MNIGQYIIYNTVHENEIEQNRSECMLFHSHLCLFMTYALTIKKIKKSKFDCPSVDYWPCEVPNRSA